MRDNTYAKIAYKAYFDRDDNPYPDFDSLYPDIQNKWIDVAEAVISVFMDNNKNAPEDFGKREAMKPKFKPRKAWAIVDKEGNILTFANGPDMTWGESLAIKLAKEKKKHIVRVRIEEGK